MSTPIKDPIKIIIKKIPQKFKTKKALFITVTVLVVLFIITRGSADKEAIELGTAKIQTISSEVVSSGKIKSVSEVDLNFAVSGKVVYIPVKEGDYIKKGQVIASLDKEIYEIALRQAKQDVIAADAILVDVYDELKDVDAESFDQKITRTAAEKTKNQAFDEVKEAESNLRKTTLTATAGGTLTELNITVGEEILYTETVASISDAQNIIFEAEIDETDVGKVLLEQKAIITLDAFPEEEIKSTVFTIGLIGITTSTEATAFEIKFSLPENEKYRIGMNGDISIIIEEKENVLAVPIEAVVEDNHVWIKTDGRYVKKEVKVGLESDFEIEIISGVSEGQQVVIDGFSEIEKKSILQKILRI